MADEPRQAAAGTPAHLPYYAPEASNRATDAEDTGRVTAEGVPILRPRGVDPDARARLDALVAAMDGVEALLAEVRDRAPGPGGASETTLAGVRDLLLRLPTDPARADLQSAATSRLDDLLARVGTASIAPGEDTLLDVLRRLLAANDGLEEITAALRDRVGAATDAPGANTVLGQLKSIAAEEGDEGTNTLLTEVRGRLDGTNARLDEQTARLDGTNARLDTQVARLDTLLARTVELTLTGRLLDRRPAPGYRLWLHDKATTNLGLGTILAEAPTGTATNAGVWRGIFVPTAGGQVSERTGFAWSDRLTGWAAE